MAPSQEIRAAALASSRKLKRQNAITALLCGAFPGVIASSFLHPTAAHWAIGILTGLLWANAFEYFYHRYLLHWPGSFFGKAHLMHHLTTGTPHEPEQVTFGSSPFWVAILFASNGIPALLADVRWHLGMAPGILVGFSIYMLVVEEIHWQVHLGGWLPGLRRMREYHLAHHDIPDGRYNVFFPLFDWLFGRIHPAIDATEARLMARAVTQFDRTEAAGWPGLTHAALSLWVLGIAIGARYFWGGGRQRHSIDPERSEAS